jgi:hypothetical protein
MLDGAVRQGKNMPVAQGPEGWGALSTPAPFCYTLIKPPPYSPNVGEGRRSRKFGRFLSALRHLVLWPTYKSLTQVYAAFVTWQAD